MHAEVLVRGILRQRASGSRNDSHNFIWCACQEPRSTLTCSEEVSILNVCCGGCAARGGGIR